MDDQNDPIIDQQILEILHQKFSEQYGKSSASSKYSFIPQQMECNTSLYNDDLSMLLSDEQLEQINTEDRSSSDKMVSSLICNEIEKIKEEQKHEEQSWKLLLLMYRDHMKQVKQ